MPVLVLIALVVGLTLASYLVLRPRRMLTRSMVAVSHGMIWVGLVLIWGHVALRPPRLPLAETTMLLGGMWTLGGGICFAIVWLSRALAGRAPASGRAP